MPATQHYDVFLNARSKEDWNITILVRVFIEEVSMRFIRTMVVAWIVAHGLNIWAVRRTFKKMRVNDHIGDGEIIQQCRREWIFQVDELGRVVVSIGR